MLNTKIISSLEKVFVDESIDSFDRLESISALRGERLSFQLIAKISDLTVARRQDVTVTPIGDLAEYMTVRSVDHTAVPTPIITSEPGFEPYDSNYLRCECGLYPDVLSPLSGNTAYFTSNQLLSLWVDIEIPKNAEAGKHTVGLRLDAFREGKVFEDTLEVEVIGATLPKQKTYLTQWFHSDCLANYYGVPAWSERHWQIVENFIKAAARNGINMILTPVFTPALDTAIGGERLTVQLVKVTKRSGKYSFNFKLLDRWIEICDRAGIKYFEIAHLSTQWGAKHAPKIMATVDGEYKKIFGWETGSLEEEYVEFLRSFLKAFIRHMKKRGDDKRCYFHISDEPQLADIENYKNVKAAIADILKDYPVMDAMSHIEYYNDGITRMPIPSSRKVQTFIDAKIPGLWTYYSCTGRVGVSNRFMAMPSWRNRSIGMQMYKGGVVGFLQWGFNFYSTGHSVGEVNPYLDASATHAFPAGDSFSVYPATNGDALDSVRIVIFHEALQDIRAMQLCEKYYKKEEIVAAIENSLGRAIDFTVCATSAKEMLGVRETVNGMIKKALEGKQ